MKHTIKVLSFLIILLSNINPDVHAAKPEDVPVFQKGGINPLPYYVYRTRKVGSIPETLNNKAAWDSLCKEGREDGGFRAQVKALATRKDTTQERIAAVEQEAEIAKYVKAVFFLEDVMLKKPLTDVTLDDIKSLNECQGAGEKPGEWRTESMMFTPRFENEPELWALLSDEKDRREIKRFIYYDEKRRCCLRMNEKGVLILGNEKRSQEEDFHLLEKVFIFFRDNPLLLHKSKRKLDIKGSMTTFLEQYKKSLAEKEYHPIAHAAWTHYEFVEIHPFDDGNGRTARLLAINELAHEGFLPPLLRDRKEYHQAIRDGLKAFTSYYCDQLILTHYDFMKEQFSADHWTTHCWNYDCQKKSTEGTKLLQCSTCNKALYCSKGCQQANWGYHKVVCKTLRSDKKEEKKK